MFLRSFRSKAWGRLTLCIKYLVLIQSLESSGILTLQEGESTFQLGPDSRPRHRTRQGAYLLAPIGWKVRGGDLQGCAPKDSGSDRIIHALWGLSKQVPHWALTAGICLRSCHHGSQRLSLRTRPRGVCQVPDSYNALCSPAGRDCPWGHTWLTESRQVGLSVKKRLAKGHTGHDWAGVKNFCVTVPGSFQYIILSLQWQTVISRWP